MINTEEELVRQHLGVAEEVAKRLSRRCTRADREEMRSVALEALLVAIRSFNPDRGLSLPVWLHHKVRFVAIDLLRVQSGRRGSSRRRGLFTCWSLDNLDPRARYHGPITESITDDSPGPDRAAEVADTLRLLLLELPPNERAVVVGSYLHGRTLDSIALDLGLCPSRCSQLRSAALAALRSRPDLAALVEE